VPAEADQLELLISARRIAARIGTLARSIDADYRGTTLSLVVVLKGAVVFAADLARRLTTPATLDFVAALSYGAGTRSAGDVALSGLDQLDVAGRHVLVVEDILDSGRTGAALLAALRERRPASLALCALLRKPTADPRDWPTVYVGFDIPADFVVGYGMDYGERYRNLPAIHRLVVGNGW